MSQPRHRRGEQHPQDPNLFFWQYHRKKERWLTREQFDSYRSVDAVRAKKQNERRRIINGETKKRHLRAKALRSNKAAQIRAYLERGKSDAFIVIACKVPLSCVLDIKREQLKS